VRILADVRERASGVPDELRQLGVDVVEASLRSGDYVVSERCLIERKTLADLHRSIGDGRLWRQIGAMRRSEQWLYLIVEGSPHDRGTIFEETIRGALLAVSDLGVAVIRTRDQVDTAHWIRRIAIRRAKEGGPNRVPYAFRPNRDAVIDPAEQALAAATGISTVTAGRLLHYFGSLLNVLQASESELRSVVGVGPSRAAAIAQLCQSSTSHSAKRNGPST
jgi:DNA excision repair protein ERCC-4